MKLCYSCKKQVSVIDKPGRSETCQWCDADLRCCLNCQFYDPRAYNQCRETQAERVLDKNRGNYCEYFSFKDSLEAATAETSAQTKKNPLDSIFKK